MRRKEYILQMNLRMATSGSVYTGLLPRSNTSLGSMLENERGKNLQILLYIIRMVDLWQRNGPFASLNWFRHALGREKQFFVIMNTT